MSYPVEVQAVVTHFDLSFTLLFVQDQTAGIYVTGKSLPAELKPGDRLAIQGTSMMGLFSPIINAASIQKLGPAELPPAQFLSLGQILSGGWDSQYAEITGVVRAVKSLAGHWKIELADGLNQLKVWTLQTNSQAPDLVGASVRIRGVVGTAFNDRQQLTGFQMYANSLEDISVRNARRHDLFASPVETITNLFSFNPGASGDECRRVQGVVTFAGAGYPTVIQDASGPAVLETARSAKVAVGDRIDAVGFLSPDLRERRLLRVVYRRLEPALPAIPAHVQVTELLRDQCAYELVTTEAWLFARPALNSQGLCLWLQHSNSVFPAWLPGTNVSQELSQLPAGCRLALTGVAALEPTRCDHSAAVHLWLRSPADVKVLARPSGQGGSLGFWILSASLAAAAAGVSCAGVINWRQKRQIQQDEERFFALQTEYQESAVQLRRSHEEHERIAQDLHDDIIQSIYAVGWRLDDCRRLMAKKPEQAESRLEQAIAALNEVIAHVRQVIAGIEPKALNGRELKIALKSLALTAGDHQTQVSIQVDPAAANLLTSQEATHFLNIAKEAMSNSLRHSQAQRAQVALQLISGAVRLEISDDGVGFDPAKPHEGHGLRNMAARARNLGARFDIISCAGQGTRVVIALPEPMPHESTRS